MNDQKKHILIALGYFLLAALVGVILRTFFVTFIPANFKYVLHTHSHIALLGWVYLGLTTLIYRIYFSETNTHRSYRFIFGFTQLTLLGMLTTFPFTGYALFSIIFSTLFLFASYLFTWFIFIKTPIDIKDTLSYKFIRAALWYMVFSSIGPWVLGIIMNTLGNTSIWYKMAIYFYLHFQYNGWFIMALCGIFLSFLERNHIELPKNKGIQFFRLLNISIILSFFLSALWLDPHWIFYVLGALGAVFQILAFVIFWKSIKPIWKKAAHIFSPIPTLLLKITTLTLVVKLLLQLLTAHPYFAQLAFSQKDLVIGYLHWVFLGTVSLALFAFLAAKNLLKISKLAIAVYLAGFFFSEALIFYKGISTWLELPFFDGYFEILIAVSLPIPISIGLMFFQSLKKH